MEQEVSQVEKDMLAVVARITQRDLWLLVKAYADFQLLSALEENEQKFKHYAEAVGADAYLNVMRRMSTAERVQAATVERITSELKTRDPFLIRNTVGVIVQELVRRLVVADGVLKEEDTVVIWPLAHLEDGSYVPPENVVRESSEGPGTSAIPDAFKGVFDNG